jgi:aspartyl/asparaginyl-tRNA synthetase
MYGPYISKIVDGKKRIDYVGNKIFQPISDVQDAKFTKELLTDRLDKIVSDEMFYHLHHIESAMFIAIIDYFKNIGADWCNLPLTTLMISSPGEIYAGKTLDYTTDTLPVNISWFDNNRGIFLSESSQFYLELRLLIEKLEKVFSVYNSFRKEGADFSHLSEFQHVEFEGKVSFNQNINIATGLMRHIVEYLLKNNKKNLSYFLNDGDIESLSTAFSSENFEIMSLKEALSRIYNETKDSKYKDFSLKHFGAWEEVFLTNLVKKHVIVTEFPLMQIPFYHNELKCDENGIPLAENADIILYGYRETIGSGVRISSIDALKEKAKAFNLPLGDYDPYIKTRGFEHYDKTAGFGMGWQRFVHWLLKLPYIWDSTHVPRGHHLPIP